MSWLYKKFLLLILCGVVITLLFTVAEAEERYFGPALLETMSIPDATDGDTWYIDGINGNDGNNGLSPTTAFKTLAKGFDRYRTALSGGDVVKIMAGTYHERISLGNIVTSADAPFIIGPYGNGKVVIDASDTHLLTWQVYDSNIYKTDFSPMQLGGSQAEPCAVIMDDNFKLSRPVYSLSDVDSFGRWYYDSSAAILYVYTGGSTPLSHDIIVTKYDENNLEYGIYGAGYEYVKVYGLTVLGASAYGIWLDGAHGKVEQCVFKYSGKGGIQIRKDYAVIRKNLVAGNVLMNWPRGRTWDTSGGWPLALVGGAYGLISGNIVHDNGGEGLGSGGAIGHGIIVDNISYNNWSVNIYVDNSPNYNISRNLVYTTGLYPDDMIDADRIPEWTSYDKILRRMRPQGIVLGDETASNPTGRSKGTVISNNIMIDCRTGFAHYGQATGAGLIDHTIANNEIVIPDAYGPGEENSGMLLPYNNGNNFNTIIKNNIIVSRHSNTPLIELRGGSLEQGLTLDNNVYYSPLNSTPFIFEYSTRKDFSTWKADTSWDANSLEEDPVFTGMIGALNSQDYKLQPDSPAIDLARTISKFTDDFNANIRGLKWDIGAFELNAIYSSNTPTIDLMKNNSQ